MIDVQVRPEAQGGVSPEQKEQPVGRPEKRDHSTSEELDVSPE